MSLEQVTAKIAKATAGKEPFGHTVKLQFPEGAIHIDGTNGNTVTNEDKPAECTVKMSLENFQSLVAGQLDPTVAFMTGKLKIDGNMGIAMKLSSLIR